MPGTIISIRKFASILVVPAVRYRWGGSVTQATNRSTGVTLNTLCGQITTNNASLAAEASVTFTVTNSYVSIGDVIILSQQSGSNGGGTECFISAVAAGSFNIRTTNNNVAAGTVETGAIILNFAIVKATSSAGK